MPIYEYECLNCGTTFEKRQSFSEEPKADCPNGHPDTRRLLAAPAIVFKGSGFYINDSRSDKTSTNGNGKKSNGTESKAETSADSKSESTSTETTAASKKESSKETA